MRLNPVVFGDKASLVLRAMMSEPQETWVVRDFANELGLSLGHVSEVLQELRNKGFIEGKNRGRSAGSRLRNPEELLQQWTNNYGMERNEALVLYSSEEDILNLIQSYFRQKGGDKAYALTLHSGANLTTSYVKDPNVYVYLDSDKFQGTAFDLRKKLDLKELKEGGNVILFRPYYKNSVFHGVQKIKGFPVVSHVQLYLDLYHFIPRGSEQAEMLVKLWREKGTWFA
ncbi:MAG: hypothetical protein LHV69_10280 [Elusimicrobia bacterium]|nr:hypothetical protein [Candidatus Obscuribacterium magneticum]